MHNHARLRLNREYRNIHPIYASSLRNNLARNDMNLKKERNTMRDFPLIATPHIFPDNTYLH